MNMKLKKVLDEIQKTEERITEWQEHLRELNIRKKQLEDAEIIKSIRSMKLNSRELLVVLDKIQNGTAVFPYLTEETTVPDTKKEEDWKDIAEERKLPGHRQKKRRMNIVRMKIKKWLAAFTVAAGMVLPATTAFALRMKRLSRRWKHLRQQRRQYRRKNRRRQRKHLFLFRGTEVWQMINQGTAQKSSLRYRQRTAIRFFLCWTVPVTKKTYICFP